MPGPEDKHISSEKLQAIAEGKKDLSRREFEHIHVCRLQAYAKAFRQRERKKDNRGGKNQRSIRSEMIAALAR